MKVVIDAFGLLGAIGKHPEVFKALDAQVHKQALALLAAQLKHKSLDLPLFQAVVSAVGAEGFEIFLDTDLVDEKFLKTLAKKLDPLAPVTKEGDGDAIRPHLIALAAGRVTPTQRSPQPAATTRRQTTRRGRSANAEVPQQPHAIATKPPGRK